MSKLTARITKIEVINKKGEVEFSTEFLSITAQRAMDIMAHWASKNDKWIVRFIRDRELFDIEGETLILKPITIWQQMSIVMYIIKNKRRESFMALNEELSVMVNSCTTNIHTDLMNGVEDFKRRLQSSAS